MGTYKTIIKGQVVRKVYYVHKFFDRLDYFYEQIDFKNIFVGHIDKPLFEIDEIVYINDLDETVEIASRLRSTNGEVIYQVNNYEIIEDEITKQSKAQAKKEIDEIRKKEELKASQNNKKWWQFWK